MNVQAMLDNALTDYINTRLFIDPESTIDVSIVFGDFQAALSPVEQQYWKRPRFIMELERLGKIGYRRSNGRDVRVVLGHSATDPSTRAKAAPTKSPDEIEAPTKSPDEIEALLRKSADEAKIKLAERKAAHDRMMAISGEVSFSAQNLDLPWFEYAPGERISFADIVERFNESFPPQSPQQVASPSKRPARLLKVNDVKTVLAWWRGGAYLGDDHLLDHRWLPIMQHEGGKLKRAYWFESLDKGSPQFEAAREAWERRRFTPL